MRESKLWFWHLVAAGVILVVLTLHMVIMHLDAILKSGDPIEWNNMLHRAKQVFFMVTYVLLVGAVLYHGLFGTRTILFELTLSKSLEKLITVVFIVVGIGLFVFGSYTAIAAFNLQ